MSAASSFAMLIIIFSLILLMKWMGSCRVMASKWDGGGGGQQHYSGGGGGFMNPNMEKLYACPLNSLCQCANLPNETYLHEISCHEVSLYKFPGKFVYIKYYIFIIYFIYIHRSYKIVK